MDLAFCNAYFTAMGPVDVTPYVDFYTELSAFVSD